MVAFPTSLRADSAPFRTTPGTQWVPAGPAADRLIYLGFADDLSEYQNGLAAHVIDFPALPAAATVDNNIIADTGLYITARNSESGLFDLDFTHATIFSEIPFSLGHDGIAGAQCPTFNDVATDCPGAAMTSRQSIAHLIDKAAFITTAPTIAGNANPLDNPISPGQALLHSGLPFNAQNPPVNPVGCPSTTQVCATGTATGSYTTTAMNFFGISYSVTLGGVCGWDLLNSAHTSAGQACQSAYKYGSDSSTKGIVNAAKTNPDFCDAAAHLQAAGLGTGVSTTDCHLLGFAPLPGGASTITFVVRSDSPPRLLLGDTLAARMCELINGAGTTSCAQITVSHQSLGQVISTVFSTRSVLLDWHMYTSDRSYGFTLEDPIELAAGTFGSVIEGDYNSAFSSSGCVATQKAVTFASNYIYWCNANYDTASNNMFGVVGQRAPTYSLAIQQAQVAMDILGSHVATIPIWSGAAQFGYNKDQTNVNDATGAGP